MKVILIKIFLLLSFSCELFATDSIPSIEIKNLSETNLKGFTVCAFAIEPQTLACDGKVILRVIDRGGFLHERVSDLVLKMKTLEFDVVGSGNFMVLFVGK